VTKHISTLIRDIQELVQRKDGWFSEDLSTALGSEIATRLSTQLGEKKEKATLRLSQMGPRCPCALWHSIHKPELAEPLPPWAEVKFSFGHIIEALAIALAKAAGHEVVGEQDELVVDGVKGHRDCVIDGCLVDVKSAASPSFEKFKTGSIRENDSFGYLDQLDGYLVGSLQDPLVKVKDRAYLFAIDKQLGHMCLYEHQFRETSILDRIRYSKYIVGLATPPKCECGTVPDGKSGNIKLDTKASYNVYKYCCFPHLRTFLYSDGPRYLTKVVRRPTRQDGTPIPEVDRFGKIIYI
jgi:hypothetical protein